MALPNFLVIGANKGGTTSLYHYLSGHPEVFMSPVKEPTFLLWAERPFPDGQTTAQRFFRRNMAATLGEYEALFRDAGGAKAIGEASTAYLAEPSRSIPNISKYLGDVRFAAVLRNPVERAFSSYAMHVALGFERRPFAETVSEGASSPHLKPGFYARSLAQYFEAFGRDSFRIFLLEDLAGKPEEVMADMFRFLDVDDGYRPDLSRRYNENRYRQVLLPKALLRTMPAGLYRLLLRRPGGGGGGILARAFFRRAVLDDRSRGKLANLYREETENLERLLGRDLSGWKEKD